MASHNTPGSFTFLEVENLLGEVQADWEDVKEILSLIEAVGRYNTLLT